MTLDIWAGESVFLTNMPARQWVDDVDVFALRFLDDRLDLEPDADAGATTGSTSGYEATLSWLSPGSWPRLYLTMPSYIWAPSGRASL
jgi:hypothetical protein